MRRISRREIEVEVGLLGLQSTSRSRLSFRWVHRSAVSS